MLFWPIYRSSHQCQLIKLDKKKITRYLQHSENAAGYDVYESSSDVSVCPICENEYPYNEGLKTKVDFIPYKDLRGKKCTRMQNFETL